MTPTTITAAEAEELLSGGTRVAFLTMAKAPLRF